jgi:hypothetical protein
MFILLVLKIIIIKLYNQFNKLVTNLFFHFLIDNHNRIISISNTNSFGGYYEKI